MPSWQPIAQPCALPASSLQLRAVLTAVQPVELVVPRGEVSKETKKVGGWVGGWCKMGEAWAGIPSLRWWYALPCLFVCLLAAVYERFLSSIPCPPLHAGGARHPARPTVQRAAPGARRRAGVMRRPGMLAWISDPPLALLNCALHSFHASPPFPWHHP